MPSFRNAITNLSNLSVTGVANSYDADELPAILRRAQLPALLICLIDSEEDRLSRERGQGFRATAFSSGARTVTYTVTHLLLAAPTGLGAGVRSHLPALINLIDNYFATLADDVTLSDELLEPAQVKVEPGIFRLGDDEFYGCAFQHTWLIAV